jgi:hypothetical protein
MGRAGRGVDSSAESEMIPVLILWNKTDTKRAHSDPLVEATFLQLEDDPKSCVSVQTFSTPSNAISFRFFAFLYSFLVYSSLA